MKTKDEQQKKEDLFLWHSFISGDEQSFNRLYDKYVHILYAYGLHYTADRDLLKDCIQDTFLKIYHDRTGLECINNIKAYLCVLLKNDLINAARREDIHLRYIQSLDPSYEDDDDTAEARIINEECQLIAQRKIEKIMSQLSARQKEVIYCRFFEGKSIDEISKIMNMNYQSVQNIIQRSIKKAANFFSEKK